MVIFWLILYVPKITPNSLTDIRSQVIYTNDFYYST